MNGEKRFETLFENNDGAFELELQLTSAGKEAGFELLNSLGEKVRIYLDAAEGRVVMDRAESGIVDFGKKVKPHDLDTEESYARYKEVTVNYKNDFCFFGYLGSDKHRESDIRFKCLWIMEVWNCLLTAVALP